MSRQEEIVTEFREGVDFIIQQQREAGQKGRLRQSGYGTGTKISGLTFGSYSKMAGRPSTFGLGSEHVWGVGTEKLRLDSLALSGYLAITSVLEVPDKLFRRWSFDSAMQAINIDCEKPIEDVELMEGALRWIRSPHFEQDTLNELAALTDEEIANVTARAGELRTSQHELQKDLESIARARRAPIPHHIIG